MLKVTNYGSACAVIESDSFRILTDPWLVGTAYLGAWQREHFLPDPVATIGPVDAIFISHCHDDHYHPESLRLYLEWYPDTLIVIGDAPYLKRIMERDGFNPLVRSSLHHGAPGDVVSLHILPNGGYEADNIDTALVVIDWKDKSAVVNMNDCPFDQAQVDQINALTDGMHVQALLPYTGAGPFPQTFEMTHMERWQEAEKKKTKFIAQFQQYREALKPDVACPFSAGYVLRGPLASLNGERGIPDPAEIPGATVLPVQGAEPRPAEVFSGYDWQVDPMPTDAEINELIQSAEQRSPKVDGPALTIDLVWGRDTGSSSAYVDATHGHAAIAHETITFDRRLLAGMLRGKYHANSIEVGSCVKIKRHGEGYDPRIWSYLYRLRA